MEGVIHHYDLLISEGNDPVLDPEPLRAYMDGWDGSSFLEALALDGTQNVLEIGVGTGRLALRTAPLCRHFTGIDISPLTIARAKEHLNHLPQVELVCNDFMTWQTEHTFDVVYSSLTFMNLPQKEEAVARIAALLAPGGHVVLSLDRNREAIIDYGTRRLRVYPDTPDYIADCLRRCGLCVNRIFSVAHADVVCACKL